MNEEKYKYKELEMDRTTKYRLLTIIFCAIQIFVCVAHVIVVLAVPSKPSYDGFFQNFKVDNSQAGLQFGFNLAIAALGVVESIIFLIASISAKRGFVLAMVPWNIMFAVVHFIGFILWALLTVTFGVFGVGIGVSIFAVIIFFTTALIASNWLLLPTTIQENSKERQIELN
eukprot:TRINITY_DN14145_c0_g1_i1.p1 TRINITY_DN14145_c0_g1~~TRINITY_DN14145_c0_g1_i1.p1  ORF type:complete len:172 (-),score=37.39 TRINITY_DN14145_c0_g1_i1:79-594(-)